MIVDSVAKVQRGGDARRAGHEPPRAARRTCCGPTCAGAVLTTGAGALGGARRRRRPLHACPPSSARSSSGRRERADPRHRRRARASASRSGEVSSVEVVRAHLDRIAEVDPDVHAYLHVAGEPALATAPPSSTGCRAAGRGPEPARRRAGRHQGRALHARHALDRRLEDPRGLGAAVRRHRRRPAPQRPASCRSARPTWTSSRWAPPPSTRPTARPATPGTSSRIPGGSGGGSAAALASFQAPLRHRHRHGRLDPPARRRHRHGRGQADLRRRSPATGLIALASSLDQAGPRLAHGARRRAACTTSSAATTANDATSL